MPKILCSQFVYGKLVTPERDSFSYDYIAFTPDLSPEVMNEIYKSAYIGQNTKADFADLYFLSPPMNGVKFFTYMKSSPKDITKRSFIMKHFIILPREAFSTTAPVLTLLPRITESTQTFRAYYEKTKLSQLELDLSSKLNSLEIIQGYQGEDWKKFLHILRGLLNHQLVNITHFQGDANAKLLLMQAIFSLLPPDLQWQTSFSTSVYYNASKCNTRLKFLEVDEYLGGFSIDWSTGNPSKLGLENYYLNLLEKTRRLGESHLVAFLDAVAGLHIPIAGEMKQDQMVQKVSNTIDLQLRREIDGPLLCNQIDTGIAQLDEICSHLVDIEDIPDEQYFKMLNHCVHKMANLQPSQRQVVAQIICKGIARLEVLSDFWISLEKHLLGIAPITAVEFLMHCNSEISFKASKTAGMFLERCDASG